MVFLVVIMFVVCGDVCLVCESEVVVSIVEGIIEVWLIMMFVEVVEFVCLCVFEGFVIWLLV